jgi:hypothetical protein
MNLIGLEVEPPLYKMPTDEELKNVIEFTHRHGGMNISHHNNFYVFEDNQIYISK